MKKEIGFMISEINFPNFGALAKVCGFDFFAIDYEHGSFDYSSLFNMIGVAKLAKFKVIVRLSNNERKDITKIMDMGADGLILPMANTKEDVQKLVNYAKYKPVGNRGISTMRAHTMYSPISLKEYMVAANSNTELYVQIETIEGLKNIKEIAEVDGLSGIIVGPNDLSCDMDCLEDKTYSKVLQAIEKVASAAHDKKLKCGIITQNDILLKKANECGIMWQCIGSELSMLKIAGEQILKKYS